VTGGYARTILYKVIQARAAVIPGRLRGEPAEHGARFGGRWWIREEGDGKGGARIRERRRRGDEVVE